MNVIYLVVKNLSKHIALGEKMRSLTEEEGKHSYNIVLHGHTDPLRTPAKS